MHHSSYSYKLSRKNCVCLRLWAMHNWWGHYTNISAFTLRWSCSLRMALCWHLSLALQGSVNLNHARKIQPCAIKELPEAFTIRGMQRPWTPPGMCHICSHSLANNRWCDYVTLSAAENTCCDLCSPEFSCFRFNNGVDCGKQAVLHERNWFTWLLHCLSSCMCQLQHAALPSYS